MNKNAIATLTTAFKNVEAKNFKLNVQKNQKKNGTAEFAKNTYWGGELPSKGMKIANRDTNGMYKNIRKYLKSLYSEMTNEQCEWHHFAYMKNRLGVEDEQNASVRFTKNLKMRIEIAKQILNGSIAKNKELCKKVRVTLARTGHSVDVVNLY